MSEARDVNVLTRAGETRNRAQRFDISEPEVSESTWRAASLLILACASVLRLYDASLTPLHHDEGVNGFFLTTLVRSGVYHYDPANYHGPTLYYFALLSQFLLGLNTFAIRFVPAAFGLATIALILCLRKYISAVGALTAAALVAVSPGAVYMSRYFIHESLFVFFTLGIVVAALRYYETTRVLYLLLASASAALLFATKETAMISAGVLLIALASTQIYMRLFAAPSGEYVERGRKGNAAAATRAATSFGASGQEDEPLARFGGASRVALAALAALALFVFLNVLFYSSFFTYSKGVADSIATFKIWTRTGTKDHVHEWYTYLIWLKQEEALLFSLGIMGACVAVWRAARANGFALFAALWSIGILAAYSLVPYKTPWLALNFIVPLAIIGGYGVGEIYRSGKSKDARNVVLGVAGICVAFALYQALSLNFRHYDDDTYPYVYAHTRRETLSLVDEIERLARRAGTNENTAIAFASPDYWPVPWYLRDYKRVGYHVAMPHPAAGSGEAIVVGNETQEAEMRAALGPAYMRVGAYELRPGVKLVLYARSDLLK
ncbi:MAG: flippase activity-associated protein Agl23 [Pyrinomonadaceae bacterium]